jgi:hypothetical protein
VQEVDYGFKSEEPTMKYTAICILSVLLASCYGPLIKTVKSDTGLKLTREDAVALLRAIEGSTYNDFLIVEILEDGIVFEDQRRIKKYSRATGPIRSSSGKEPPIFHGVKNCSDVARMGLEVLLSPFFQDEDSYNSQSIEKRMSGSLFLLPWGKVGEVDIVYPLSNVFFSFSVFFMILPNFYMLDFCNTEGKLLFSVFPAGQYKKNFLITSKIGSNYEYCKRIASAVFVLKRSSD